MRFRKDSSLCNRATSIKLMTCVYSATLCATGCSNYLREPIKCRVGWIRVSNWFAVMVNAHSGLHLKIRHVRVNISSDVEQKKKAYN